MHWHSRHVCDLLVFLYKVLYRKYKSVCKWEGLIITHLGLISFHPSIRSYLIGRTPYSCYSILITLHWPIRKLRTLYWPIRELLILKWGLISPKWKITSHYLVNIRCNINNGLILFHKIWRSCKSISMLLWKGETLKWEFLEKISIETRI